MRYIHVCGKYLRPCTLDYYSLRNPLPINPSKQRSVQYFDAMNIRIIVYENTSILYSLIIFVEPGISKTQDPAFVNLFTIAHVLLMSRVSDWYMTNIFRFNIATNEHKLFNSFRHLVSFQLSLVALVSIVALLKRINFVRFYCHRHHYNHENQ